LQLVRQALLSSVLRVLVCVLRDDILNS